MKRTFRSILCAALLPAFALLPSCSTLQTEVPVESIHLAPSVLELQMGQTERISATVLPGNAADKSVVWESSDPLTASVDQDGNVTGLRLGQAVVKAVTNDGGLSASCQVTVTEKEIPLVGIALSPETLELDLGDEALLEVVFLPEDATDKDVSWMSRNPSVVSVDVYGRVVALAEGQAEIVASVSGGKFTASCMVTVTDVKYFPVETVLVPAGTFLMGSPEDEPGRNVDESQHKVTISKDFYIGKYEVTNTEYAEFLNDVGVQSDGMYATESYGRQMLVHNDEWGVIYDSGKWKSSAGRDNYPVVAVSWYGAYEYARWAGGSLPTEAQWEYACRGGQKESLPFGIGDGTKLTYDMANFSTEAPYDLAKGGDYIDENKTGYLAMPTQVGSYPFPNGYGIYDMHGNVYEWCMDWKYDYPSEPVTDPTGPSQPNPTQSRVIRGGSWLAPGRYNRSADRDHLMPGGLDIYIGFRVVFEK